MKFIKKSDIKFTMQIAVLFGLLLLGMFKPNRIFEKKSPFQISSYNYKITSFPIINYNEFLFK